MSPAEYEAPSKGLATSSAPGLSLGSSVLGSRTMPCGRVAERTKATVLKTVSGATRSWVRIPPLPPSSYRSVKVRAVGLPTGAHVPGPGGYRNGYRNGRRGPPVKDKG